MYQTLPLCAVTWYNQQERLIMRACWKDCKTCCLWNIANGGGEPLVCLDSARCIFSFTLKWCNPCNAFEFGQRCLWDIPCEGGCFFGVPGDLRYCPVSDRAKLGCVDRCSERTGNKTKKMTLSTCFVPGLLGISWRMGTIRVALHVLVTDNGFLTSLFLFSLHCYWMMCESETNKLKPPIKKPSLGNNYL